MNLRAVLSDKSPEELNSLTFEKVFQVFHDYLNEDDVIEIVKLKHGYAVLLWYEKNQEYTNMETFTSPLEFADFLASQHEIFHELQLDGNGSRDLSEEEKEPLVKASQELLLKCYQN